MARMIFDLTDDDREALETLRARLGLRSQAETLRHLIRQAAASREILTPAEKKAAVAHAVEFAGSFKPVPYGSRLKKR